MVEQNRLRVCKSKPRVFIISDISNEPDDAESLVRYLTYSNEFDTRGLVACTSTWMKNRVCPQDMRTIVDGYAQVVNNLNAHVHPDNPYPTAEYLHSIIRGGPAMYGKKALAADVPLNEGAALLIEQLDASPEPLWVLCWGGTNTLAQALQHVQKTRSETEFTRLRAKLRVYAISDQDDTGLWIRVKFPDIFYIVSMHGWCEYSNATWTAISADNIATFDRGGTDKTKISREWVIENIQVGPLGKVYPNPAFIIEGDTPTFLYLIQNGLGSPEHPNWGSWGGRYSPLDFSADRDANWYTDALDMVVGANGEMFHSNHASIWRWRNYFQTDFAARMRWTLTADRSDPSCNHAPVVVVNDSTPGPEPYLLEAEAETELILNASKSYDPDGDEMSFEWFQYKEPTITDQWLFWVIPDIEFESTNDSNNKTQPTTTSGTPDTSNDADTADKPVTKGKASGPVVKIKLPSYEKCSVDLVTGQAMEKGMQLHLILQVTDQPKSDKAWKMTTYKRVVIQITNKELKGGRETGFGTVTEAIGMA